MNDIVVGIGEVLWDVLPDGKKTGGAPANFAYHVSQFGIDSCAVSAVGRDELGTELMAAINEKGVKHHFDTVPYPTGTVQVRIDGAGIPQYEIKENVAWDNIPYTAALENLAKHTRAVCFGSLAQRSAVSRDTINRFLDAMPQGDGRPVVFDVNLRLNYYNNDILRQSMRRCNILKINDEELAEVSRLFGYPDNGVQKNCRRLLDEYDLRILILTCGTDGSYVFTPEGMSFRQTPKVVVADTVGAGDSFTAAFVAGLLKGLNVEEAHEKAVATSAYVCTRYGAMPALPADILR